MRCCGSSAWCVRFAHVPAKKLERTIKTLSNSNQLSLKLPKQDGIVKNIITFNDFNKETLKGSTEITVGESVKHINTFVNEFWTSKQRAANSLHEISFRACFKPQLPRFFIERMSRPGDLVYDPFSGRGTTLIEAALLGRIPLGCDVSPLSPIMTLPRLHPPFLEEVEERLAFIDLNESVSYPEELLVFYHQKTLKQICALRGYFFDREREGNLDDVDKWIRLVAINRLTGHSSGFFSVYSLPPNQAVSVESQQKINLKREQVPPLRDVKKIILKKSKSLLKECNEEVRWQLKTVASRARILTQTAEAIPQIQAGSIHLAVTSPPFLDVVNYAQDNWLRCWFCGIDPKVVPITMSRKVEDWQEVMTRVFKELKRVLKPGGHVAFEVGEVRHGEVKLEEAVMPCGLKAGLEPLFVLVNDQKFTKTANVWGVENNKKGTNTNRIVVFRK